MIPSLHCIWIIQEDVAMKMSANANYGNWVSAAMMKMLWAATAVIYGDMEEFLKELRSEGVVREIHYIADIEKKASVPAFVTAPWMIRNAGLIYGIK